MSLNISEIELLARELFPRWQGSFIQKIHMNGPRMIWLTLKSKEDKGVMCLSVLRGSCFFYLDKKRGKSDESASSFCMILRKWLKGSKIIEISQLDQDRVIQIKGTRGTLIAEMFGNSGRFILCDSDSVVLGLSPSDASREGLLRGSPYSSPGSGENRASPGQIPRKVRLTEGRANETALELYGKLDDKQEGDSLRTLVVRRLASKIKSKKRLVGKLEADSESSAKHEELNQRGELLKLSFHQIRRGMSSIKVHDLLFGTDREVEIPLDPKLSPQENIQQTFKKARKARRSVEIVSQRLEEARKDLERLQGQQQDIEGLAEDKLTKIALSLGIDPEAASSSRDGKKRPPRLPYKTYVDLRGRKILVGKSADDNDKLTVQVARPHDLWLHVRGFGGSHVVVPLNKGEQVDSERLIDAATLAAHFSEARGDTTLEVNHILRKYVRKSRGSPPGMVELTREKVLLLSLEPDRLKRLLSSRIDE